MSKLQTAALHTIILTPKLILRSSNWSNNNKLLSININALVSKTLKYDCKAIIDHCSGVALW